ncbi:hypothetical protein ASG21_00870 [Chryseobacterium sp. Leaf394]|nr:hypothetical protein ASG21_00870 [Chryseobacterium sp. Leaf394]
MHELYLVVIFLCLAFSINIKKARHRFLYIYFVVVFLSETLIYCGIIDGNVYEFTKYFYILYIIFYYKKIFKTVHNVCILIFIVAICFLSVKIIGQENLLAVIQSFIYVFLALEWMRQEINNVNEISISDKQEFWFSVGLLLWSSIFLMRIVPSIFFASNDDSFFRDINFFYQWITIICYGIFLKGIFSVK